jgi:DNA-binding response OmpR family regulator
MPGVYFFASSDNEKIHIAYHCAILASGFYERRKLLVVPAVLPKYASRCVVIPACVQTLPQSFWHDACRVGQTLPILLTEYMKSAVRSLPVDCATVKEVSTLENAWRRVERAFWRYLGEIIPDRLQWIQDVEVRVTRYATRASHYFLERVRGQHLIVHVRTDGTIADLAQIILLALLWPDRNKMDLTLTKRMAVADYLMSTRPLVELFGPIQTSLREVQIPSRLRRQRDAYVQSLGAPVVASVESLLTQNRHIFGEKEWEIMSTLLGRPGDLVTYDEFATRIWGEGEFRSYWAINKLVQRIKVKLLRLGVSAQLLHVVRGQGCMWGV